MSECEMNERTNGLSAALYERARAVIPGGTQLLSKRPEMWAPGRWPAYFREARGCEIVDVDGRTWLDMSAMGIGACLLGYNDADVTRAVVDCVKRGSMCTLNPPDEVALAEQLIALHPWASGVRFARTGGEAMAIAVRLARASTARDHVAICGYHGWHDWYLAANLVKADDAECGALDGHLLPGLAPKGVPRGLAGTAHTFRFNCLDELAAIIKAHGHELAAVVMEPTRHTDPAAGFLEGVRELSTACGARLVFDEITSGWRFHFGGAHLKYGVWPDVAVFAKALGNGHPMAAVVGAREVMDAAQETFISSTYWTEAVGPAAALATLKKMSEIDLPGGLPAYLAGIGGRLRDGLTEIARKCDLPLVLKGHAALTTIGFEHPENLALQTLMTQRMLDAGILAGGAFYASLAHEAAHVDRYLEAIEPVLGEIHKAIEKADVMERLDGPVRHGGFKRLS